MGAGSGIALKFVQWFLRGVQFLGAGLILAVFSYFLATLHNHQLDIATWIRAVEGISGAATLYAAIGLLLLCCLAGLTLTSFIAIALDVAFIGAFVYVAVATRGGATSCRGRVDTPFGSGDADTDVPDPNQGGFTNLPSFRTACKLQTATFAVSIVLIIFFILSALVEFALARHHQREKRFGPSPANNYTGGYGKTARRGGVFGLLGRRRNRDAAADPHALPAHTHPNAVRDSYATETTAVPPHTGTVGAAGTTTGGKLHQDAALAHGTHEEPAVAQYPAGNYRYEDGVYNNGTTGHRAV